MTILLFDKSTVTLWNAVKCIITLLTVSTWHSVPSCSQPKSPTMNFMISYDFYGPKECLCKIFQNFILGKGLIFALKVWDFSKKQEQVSANEGNRTQRSCVTGEYPDHYTNASLMKIARNFWYPILSYFNPNKPK